MSNPACSCSKFLNIPVNGGFTPRWMPGQAAIQAGPVSIYFSTHHSTGPLKWICNVPKLIHVMGNRALRSLSLSYPKPKDGLTGGVLPILLVWQQLLSCTLLPSQIIFYSRCHTQRSTSRALPANPFGMTMTKSYGISKFFPGRGSNGANGNKGKSQHFAMIERIFPSLL